MVPSIQPDISQRIAQIRLEMEGPRGKASFAKRLGLSPSTYDYYEGNRVPPADVLVRIADVGGVDLYWLITGKAGPSVSPSHPVLQRAARLLSEIPDAAAPLAAFIEILAESAKFPRKAPERPAQAQAGSTRPAEREETKGVPGVAARAEEPLAAGVAGDEAPRASWIPVLGRSAAGVPHFWASRDDAAGVTMLEELVERHSRSVARRVRPATAVGGDRPGEDVVAVITLRQAPEGQPVEFISAKGIKSRYADAFALRIDGESMAPDIRHGDIVIVSPSAPAVDGRAVVVQLARQIGVTCKLYRRSGKSVHLIPVNEQFRPQTYPAGQVDWALRVLARVRG
jgi:transcriptional regulator with XRE-family HTH domain